MASKDRENLKCDLGSSNIKDGENVKSDLGFLQPLEWRQFNSG